MESSTGKGVRVEVEYCSGWGYGNRYEKLRNEILAVYPNTDVTGNKGRRTSFEIKINGREVFSKLKVGSFPESDSVIKAVGNAAKEEDIGQIEAQPKSCCLM